jgi:hypothetical protein
MMEIHADRGESKVVLIVTLIVVLGEQNERILKAAGLTGVAVDKKNLTPEASL